MKAKSSKQRCPALCVLDLRLHNVTGDKTAIFSDKTYKKNFALQHSAASGIKIAYIALAGDWDEIYSTSSKKYVQNS